MFQRVVLRKNVLDHFVFFKTMLIRPSIQSMSTHPSGSKRDDKSHHNSQDFTHGLSAGLGIVSAGLGIAAVLGLFSYAQNWIQKLGFSVNSGNNTSDDIKTTMSPRTTFNFLADVVEKTKDAVVYIEIVAKHPFSGRSFPISNGSGFIVKSNGLILTNAHVVNHYGHVNVKLYDGREYSAVVEHYDTESDLATIRIIADNLPVLPLGCSADLRPGEFIIAMGNPLTLSHTITSGVVSANRQGVELGANTDYIQTDAAINSGNSGGPLVNLDGEAVGINTMKVTEGISFAVPSDHAIEFLKQIENKKPGSWNPYTKSAKQSKRKYLGITMMNLTPLMIKDLREQIPGFPEIEHGVLIWRVMVGSPSYEFGIKSGDVIMQVNGQDVYNSAAVEEILEKVDVVHLTIYRGQKKYEVSIDLVEPLMP